MPFHLTYKTIITMQYIFIVALEFVLAFIGVALLIRYYNHKWQSSERRLACLNGWVAMELDGRKGAWPHCASGPHDYSALGPCDKVLHQFSHFVADCCSCRHNIRQKSARYLPTSQKRHTFAPSNRTNNIWATRQNSKFNNLKIIRLWHRRMKWAYALCQWKSWRM